MTLTPAAILFSLNHPARVDPCCFCAGVRVLTSSVTRDGYWRDVTHRICPNCEGEGTEPE